MIRTQIYLPKPMYEDIKLRAEVAGKPAAEVLRDLVYKGLTVKQEQTKKRDGLLKLASLGITGGPANLAIKLDDYLYGGHA